MNARHATPLILTALTLVLTACGNKGPLVLPTQPAPQEAPRAKPGEVPVTISNANDPPVATDPKAKTSLPTPPLGKLTSSAAKKDCVGKDGKVQDSKTQGAKTQDAKTQDGSVQDAKTEDCKDSESTDAPSTPASAPSTPPKPSGQGDG
ncbi:MAG: LPS translocon maturation chaperone LptM [Lysobacter sp.]